MPYRRRRTLVVGLACAALAFAGCGGSEDEADAPAASQTPAATPAATKPDVIVPKGKLPKKLVKRDLKVGTGAVAEPGKTVQVQYVGVSAANGRQFDASWERGEPFTFQLGAQQVIPGWDQG